MNCKDSECGENNYLACLFEACSLMVRVKWVQANHCLESSIPLSWMRMLGNCRNRGACIKLIHTHCELACNANDTTCNSTNKIDTKVKVPRKKDPEEDVESTHGKDEDCEVLKEEGKLVYHNIVICVLNSMLIKSINDEDEDLEADEASGKGGMPIVPDAKKAKAGGIGKKDCNLVLLSSIEETFVSFVDCKKCSGVEANAVLLGRGRKG